MTKIYEPKIIKLMEGDIKKYHKVLLEYGGFDNIRDAKKQTGNNANQIYSHLFDEIQKFISDSNKQEYKKKFQSIALYNKEKNEKKKLEKEVLKQQKQITQLKQKKEKSPINHLTSKISKEQRKKRYSKEQQIVKEAKEKLKSVLHSNKKVVGVWLSIYEIKGAEVKETKYYPWSDFIQEVKTNEVVYFDKKLYTGIGQFELCVHRTS